MQRHVEKKILQPKKRIFSVSHGCILFKKGDIKVDLERPFPPPTLQWGLGNRPILSLRFFKLLIFGTYYHYLLLLYYLFETCFFFLL